MGEQKEEFHIHKGFICSTSKFFRTALKPEWDAQKLNPGTIDLTDEDPEIFRLYAHWVYCKTLPILATKEDQISSNFPQDCGHSHDKEAAKKRIPALAKEEFHLLAKCYVLGEKLIDTTFKNIILLNGFIHATRGREDERYFPDGSVIAIIYAGTTKRSPARKLMVDIYVDEAHLEAEGWEQDFHQVPAEFLLDIAKALIKARPGQSEGKWEACIEQYHEEE